MRVHRSGSASSAAAATKIHELIVPLLHMTNDRTRARPGWLLLPSSTAARSCVCCAGCGAVDRRPLCRYAATPLSHYTALPLRRKVRSVWPTHVCAHHPAQTGCAMHRPSDGLCCAQAVWPPHEHCERQRMCACACRRLALAPRRAAARVSACRADVDGAVCRQVHLGAAAAYGVTSVGAAT